MTEAVFELPFRIHWTPGPEASDDLMRAVRRSRPLAVLLHLTGARELGRLHLPWKGVSITAVINGWKQHRGPLPVEEVDRWEFPVDDIRDAKWLAGKGLFGVSPFQAGLRWTPRKGELRALPEMMATAASLGCCLTLPNRPADAITSLGIEAFPCPGELTGKTMDRLRDPACAIAPGMLRVHDYIMAAALTSQTVETGGCQAANSVAFIDQDGNVYPCESLKVALGNLGRMSMESIWASPARKEVLKEIRSLPAVCRNCKAMPACRGGCRGAAFHLTGCHGSPDPMCPLREVSCGD